MWMDIAATCVLVQPGFIETHNSMNTYNSTVSCSIGYMVFNTFYLFCCFTH